MYGIWYQHWPICFFWKMAQLCIGKFIQILGLYGIDIAPPYEFHMNTKRWHLHQIIRSAPSRGAPRPSLPSASCTPDSVPGRKRGALTFLFATDPNRPSLSGISTMKSFRTFFLQCLVDVKRYHITSTRWYHIYLAMKQIVILKFFIVFPYP